MTRIPEYLNAIAVDPLDETLWVVRYTNGLRLENYDGEGRHIGSLELGGPAAELGWGGAE